jgi:non-homologous end joining protein Ku
MKLIKARIKGEKPRLPDAQAPPEGKVVDLMERLRQSLAQNQQRPAARGKPAKRARSSQAKTPAKRKTRHAA